MLVTTNTREFDLLKLALACYFKSKSLLLLPLSYELLKDSLYNLNLGHKAYMHFSLHVYVRN